jgi:hypothetical protein
MNGIVSIRITHDAMHLLSHIHINLLP